MRRVRSPEPSVVLLLALLAGCSASHAYEGDDAGECADGADNDRDGDFDCADTDCAASSSCSAGDSGSDSAADTGPVGSSADVSGSAGGIRFGATAYAFFGGPFVVISMRDVACDELGWIAREYHAGTAPTSRDTELLQLAYMATDTVTTGRSPVSPVQTVSATVVRVEAGRFSGITADGGLLEIEEVVDANHASGTFEGLAFPDGVLSGSFHATWCSGLDAR
jgi:hypothetical protein